jgi:hypothetical protein
MRHELLISAAVAILYLAAPGTPRAQQVRVPEPDVLLMLVRTTLIALNQANFTGNYTVLHGLGTPRLQAGASPAQLGIAFTRLREQRLDLSRVLVIPPELTAPPSVATGGRLRLSGIFRTSPVRIGFEMVFMPVDGIWRIEGLAVQALPASGSAAPHVAEAPVVLKGSQ